MALADESSLAAGRARVLALADEIAAADREAPRLIETPISWVLLGSALAYKIKKPVRLAFLDFRTLAARRRYCEEELRLNRRFAPALYLDVVEIREGASGPSLLGTGRVLELAVRMQRFPDGSLWSERIGAAALGPAEIDAFAQRLAAIHRVAAIAPADGEFGTAT